MNAALLAKLRRAGIEVPEGAKSLGIKLPEGLGVPSVSPSKATQARYTKPGDDGMTGLERAYGKLLEDRKRGGEIVDYGFQVMKLLLIRGVTKSEEAEGVKSSWYEPDFTVYENDGTISQHETKGYLDMASDGWLKFKNAASLYPFAFYFAQRTSKAKGTWNIKRYGR